MNMPTHMSIKKDSMLSVIKWLWNKCYEMAGDTNEVIGNIYDNKEILDVK